MLGSYAMKSGREQGMFVVIEGVDGAGTTTQVHKLVDRLRQEGLAARGTREPSDGPLGTMIRQVLTGRIVVPPRGSEGPRAPGWTTMALLFAADRMDHVETEISPFVEQGGVIVSDRYDASSLAYQSVSSGREGEGAVDWIRALNKHAMRPHVTIVVDVPADLAAERRRARGEASQLYEQNETQRALVLFYKDLERHMPHDRIVLVDGVGTVEQVHERIFEAYQAERVRLFT